MKGPKYIKHRSYYESVTEQKQFEPKELSRYSMLSTGCSMKKEAGKLRKGLHLHTTYQRRQAVESMKGQRTEVPFICRTLQGNETKCRMKEKMIEE